MKKAILFILAAGLFVGFKPLPGYQIFSGDKEKEIDFEKMMKGLDEADVIFFGESHNNSLCHWLELQVLKALAEEKKEIIVGAEMFESDDQLVIDEYMTGLIKEDHLIKEAKVWDNYETDYAPILNFAKENDFKFIATNIPRRYASMVARNGLESLEQTNEAAQSFFAPLPIKVDYDLSSYKEMAEMMGGHMGMNHMVDAQAVKDATMAYFIAENLTKKSVFYHLNGSFHSDNKQGIIYYLQKYDGKLNIRTISVVEQDDITSLEEDNKGVADYIIVIPSDMTKSY